MTEPCGHCGMNCSSTEMVHLGQFAVCIQCKPVVEQKIRENLLHVELFWHSLPYADIGSRAMAKVFDWLFLYTLMIPLNLIINMGFLSQSPWIAMGVNTFLNTVFGIIYTVWTISKYAATPGKKIMNLEIVTPDGGRVTAWRAFGRFWAEMLSSTLFGLGYFTALGDEECRTLHDRLCGTRIVRKQALDRRKA